MNSVLLGVIFGLVFGIIDVLIMIPLKFDTSKQKIEAMTGAFIDRFAIGLLIPNVNLGFSPIITGLLLGLLLSLPSAIITRVYMPIIGIGSLGGLIIGFISQKV